MPVSLSAATTAPEKSSVLRAAPRRDLLPDAYIDELELLHDQLPAMGMNTVRAMVEAELGVPLTELASRPWPTLP